MSESTFWSVCTKCGHCESSEILLSRFCPRCGYMRGVRKVGETDDQGRERDKEPLTIEERLMLGQVILRTPSPADLRPVRVRGERRRRWAG